MLSSADAGELDGLLSIYNRVCGHLGLDHQDESLARVIARTIIEAALAGELDPEGLYERALRVASIS